MEVAEVLKIECIEENTVPSHIRDPLQGIEFVLCRCCSYCIQKRYLLICSNAEDHKLGSCFEWQLHI